jgi:hypothetical protein
MCKKNLEAKANDEKRFIMIDWADRGVPRLESIKPDPIWTHDKSQTIRKLLINMNTLHYRLPAILIVAVAFAFTPLLELTAMTYEEKFAETAYGQTPVNWRDAFQSRPTRAWAVDGNGLLRQLLKKQFGSYPDDRVGLLLLTGDDGGTSAGFHAITDGEISARFRKTEDDLVSFGIAARAVDQDNYYVARFRGADRLELLKCKDGQMVSIDFIEPIAETHLLSLSGPRKSGLATMNRYRDGDEWMLVLTLDGELLTARVYDERGIEQARVKARDADFTHGYVGLCSTRFAAASEISIEAHVQEDFPVTAGFQTAFIPPVFPIVKPYWRVEEMNTARPDLSDDYDVIVAGGGTGGFGAAIQAARMGMRVLILEETDWLGGQMAAGVTTMDEASGWWKYSVRERGIYREFNESMLIHYLTLDKDPMLAYFTYPHQTEGGYEPRVARAVLYGFIHQERRKGAVIDISLRSRIVAVEKEGEIVTGVTVEFLDEEGLSSRSISSSILIDATEYGDVIPLTGARYRSGNRISPDIDLGAPVQDHTWLAIVREYPEGIPAHLQMKEPPPGYEAIKRRFSAYSTHGYQIWGPEARGLSRPAHWRRYFAWRGLVDSASPLTGERSTDRHTRSGFNGGNDYPVTAATLEDAAQRLLDEREGIYRSLGILYYFQQELGIPWSLAEDEGYNTYYNRVKMERLDLRPDLLELAVHLPQQPYVRESRRIVGVGVVRGDDLSERDEKATLFPTSVAMGDYGMDLDHGDTAGAYEKDLDSGPLSPHSGPFMVPFEAFIPEVVDGFVAAEKNISQSRRASGATRMQPSTMLTGQAAGAIAALSIQNGIQPRELDPVQVQAVLLEAGSTLVPRWHVDVPFRSEIWKATQLLSLYEIMDRPGFLTKDMRSLGVDHPWGVEKPLCPNELRTAIERLAQLTERDGVEPRLSGDTVSREDLRVSLSAIDPNWAEVLDRVDIADTDQVTAGEFLLVAAGCLLERF